MVAGDRAAYVSSADARVVLVEYSVGEHETYVFVVTPEGTAPQVAKIAVGKAALARLARRLTALGADEAFRDPVLASLVMPAVGATQPGDVIYFVPHGALHRIPLQAVHVDGAPVIERNPVTVAPSASALRYCRAKRKGQRRSALIVADPGGASAPWSSHVNRRCPSPASSRPVGCCPAPPPRGRR
ncbi:hypothetical protein SAV31267_004440 [Streptomyces avermitilis]|uniref:CHAT domain-containing protein n=1 Tax=Streptomyces avermitilis TaxID=33903 RepID=A0A4D4MHH7_STRAX|nr:hypothetical protein SAV31267_004440 [Streptomyces avermitilis]